jgi:predicted methyltransferase
MPQAKYTLRWRTVEGAVWRLLESAAFPATGFLRMTRLIIAAALVVALVPGALQPVHAATPKAIEAAVADSARPEADKARDANRKPAEAIAFAGVKPGQKVVDLFAGAGYFTRILSAVVGAKGHVYALMVPPPPNAPAGAPDRAAAVKAIAADPHYANVSVGTFTVQELKLPEPVDLIWTSQNYHDFHNMAADGNMLAFDKQVFAALKPGGFFVVEDHVAEAGSGARDTKTLHRIDPEAVKKEAAEAGFVLAGQSDLLKNPDDPHTANVFDASIRGKTDQFILKFRRPN